MATTRSATARLTTKMFPISETKGDKSHTHTLKKALNSTKWLPFCLLLKLSEQGRYYKVDISILFNFLNFLSISAKV